MKKFLFAAVLLLSATGIYAQSSSLPNTSIKNVGTGQKVAFNTVVSPGRVTVISFWATWCVPCKKEINNIRKKMPEWKKDTDFDYVTISQDDSRAEGMVRSYAKSQGWDFPYFIDANSDLRRSLNFQNVPYTMIIDKDGKVAWMHAGYEEGGEDELIAKVRELAK